MKKYEYAVLIGRFQPFHIGHEQLFQHASKLAQNIIFIIGSHNSPVSIRNPWTTEERERFIRQTLSRYDPECIHIQPVSDSAYNFNDWLIRVQRQVEVLAGNSKIVLVGHYKDDTSYYLNYFPQWSLEALPIQANGLSSTAVRIACFEGQLEEIKKQVSGEVFEALKEWMKTETFKALLEEYQFIRQYRKKWEGAPYPPTFVTADAVVMALGHILLIRRKLNPGKGKLALPGGFVNADESIEKACLRELREETSLEIGYKELKGSIKMSQVFDHPLRDPRGRVITHAYMFELNVKELPGIKGGDDASEAFWYPLYKMEEQENQFFNDHAQIIKYFINRMR